MAISMEAFKEQIRLRNPEITSLDIKENFSELFENEDAVTAHAQLKDSFCRYDVLAYKTTSMAREALIRTGVSRMPELDPRKSPKLRTKDVLVAGCGCSFDAVKLENFWQHGDPDYRPGPIDAQGNQCYFPEHKTAKKVAKAGFGAVVLGGAAYIGGMGALLNPFTFPFMAAAVPWIPEAKKFLAENEDRIRSSVCTYLSAFNNSLLSSKEILYITKDFSVGGKTCQSCQKVFHRIVTVDEKVHLRSVTFLECLIKTKTIQKQITSNEKDLVIRQKQQEIDSKDRKIGEHEGTIVELQGRVTVLVEEKGVLVEEKGTLIEEKRGLEQRLYASESARKADFERTVLRDSRISDLIQQRQELDQQSRALEEQQQRIAQVIEELASSRDSIRSDRDEARLKMLDLEKENDDLKQKISELKKALDELSPLKNQTIQERLQKERRIAHLEHLHEKNVEKISNLNRDLSRLTLRNADHNQHTRELLKLQADSFNRKASEKDEKIASLSRRLRELTDGQEPTRPPSPNIYATFHTSHEVSTPGNTPVSSPTVRAQPLNPDQEWE